jgi:phage terminase large subunit-like protein
MTKAKRSPRGASARGKSRAELNIAWIETVCCIPEGRDVGRPVRLREWQRQEIIKIYDNPHGTRRAILSFGRKNGKTALAAFLLLLHLCGREAKANSQLYSAAQSRDQAGILFSLAAKIVRLSPKLLEFVVIRDTAKQLFCPEMGTLYRALSAEASTAYGLSPSFIVHDELGQVKGPRSELYEALETATAAQESPISIIISTQAPTDADLLSVLIDDALLGSDPRVVVSLYTAPPEMDAFGDDAIRAANPAFGDFQSAEEVRAMAEDARRMPARQAEYENLILNRRVERNNPFVSLSVWRENGEAPHESLEGLPVYIGLDLSETSDLTAMVMVAPDEGLYHIQPIFWLPREGLADKAKKDRYPYDVWARDGLIETTPGRSIEYEYIAVRLCEIFDKYDVRKVAFDRWNMKHLTPWLVRAGLDPDDIEARFFSFGQGFQSMSPALRDLEAALMNKRLRHGNHPVLDMCATNAVVEGPNAAGGRKLTKAKSRARIDGMVALAMALSVATTEEGPDMSKAFDSFISEPLRL